MTTVVGAGSTASLRVASKVGAMPAEPCTRPGRRTRWSSGPGMQQAPKQGGRPQGWAAAQLRCPPLGGSEAGSCWPGLVQACGWAQFHFCH